MKSLKSLLKAAQEAPPETRIQLRDAIAEHGVEAIDAVTPWLADPRLGAFATRVITVAGRAGHTTEAVAAFTTGLDTAANEAIRRDVEAGLAEFAPPKRRRAVSGRTGYEILAEDGQLRERPAVRYRIETHKARGSFNIPRVVLDLLAVPADGVVDMEVRRSGSGDLVFSGLMGTSGTKLAPLADDAAVAELKTLDSYESIDVTVARAE
ncbi:MAG: hypothetical protein OEV61_12825 [Chloroflexota bacterium]|jgi:hypothetical protein|nr:hypothetical protein [Chloroflexota bacterium]